MRILFAAGGTAGHINPAIAIADAIKEKNSNAEILFVGTPEGMEAQLVPKAGYHFFPIKVHGFQRSISFKNIERNFKAAYRVLTSNFDADRILRRFRPQLVIGTGGYVSGPVLRKAAQLGIKTAIHEQNAYPGVTNKMLAKQVDLVMLAVEEARKLLPQAAKTVVVGNPIRKSILFKSKEQARKELGIDQSFCILSFGGSLGAAKVNEIAADVMQWHCSLHSINHIHATGKLGKESFAQMLKDRNINPNHYHRLKIETYIDQMDTCLAAADLVICRAGAITLSELEATGSASVLVPSPYVAENHQYHNALVLQNHRAAIVVEEKDYNRQKLLQQIEDFHNHPGKLKEFSKNASALAIVDSCERIYQYLQELISLC